MANHHSIATVIDKNRVASLEAFVPMMVIEVIADKTGAHIDTLRVCENGNADMTYRGDLYVSTDFKMSFTTEADRPSECNINFFDRTSVITRYMETYRGGIGFKIDLFFVNTGDMNQPPEFKETFSVRSASADTGSYMITFTLGMENPLSLRVPRRTQRRDRCQWRYKGDECRYTGSLKSCDYTLQGDNGCAAHNNVKYFGGFPGIDPA